MGASVRAAPWIQRRVERIFAAADVGMDGQRPWDIKVRDGRLYRRLAIDAMDGLGDAYMDGWWECGAIDQMVERLLRSEVPAWGRFGRLAIGQYVRHRLFNLQSLGAARRNGQAHYDRGNDLFEAMLDKRMIYTCGYWKEAATLDEAQEAKLDLVCRKIGLRAGQRVLDIGCGWGGFAQFAAERYGAQVVGVTVSEEQVALARQRCKGLAVEIRLQDYRQVDERFDHIISLGMFEHVGPRNYRTYMQTAHRCLSDDGLFLLHSFATRDSFPNMRHSEMAWINRHIFPGLVVPSMKQIGGAIDGLFVMEDVQNFGAYYDPTLRAWFANFERNWAKLESRYGERFYRMWKYYLLACAGAFRARAYQLWQMVLSKDGVRGVYEAVR